jgi:uncharacterized MAPEG superfamily protein
MSTPVLCLLLFAAWAIVLVLTLAGTRVIRVLRRQQAANSFTSGVPHGGDRYWRLNRAHLNTIENLPIFGALVVAAELSGVRTDAISTAAIAVVIGRVAQTVIHVASNSNLAVNLRFTAFTVQLGSFGWMIVELLRRT